MRTKIVAATLAAALGLTGAALAAPALAGAESRPGALSRLAEFKDALKGLVTDGTLNQ